MAMDADARIVYGIPLDSECASEIEAAREDTSEDVSEPPEGLRRVAWLWGEGRLVAEGLRLESSCVEGARELVLAIDLAATDRGRAHAWLSHNSEVTGMDLSRRPEWDDRLVAALAHLGLTAEAGKGPGWWLIVEYG